MCPPCWGQSVIIGVAGAGQEIATPVSTCHRAALVGFGIWRAKGRSQLPDMVEQAMQGDIQLAPFVTHTMPLEDINTAFDLMHEGKSIRSVLHFRGGNDENRISSLGVAVIYRCGNTSALILPIDMTFVYLFYPQKLWRVKRVPCSIGYRGLPCTEQNFIQKSGFAQFASHYNIIVVAPDTSPRGDNVADDSACDLGQGAGFYVMPPKRRGLRVFFDV